MIQSILKSISANPVAAALKIWISGVVLGPIFLAVGSLIFTPEDSLVFFREGPGSILLIWLWFMAASAIFSFPSLLLLALGLYLLFKKPGFGAGLWGNTLIFTFLLTVLPFSFFGEHSAEIYGFAGTYLAGIWLGVFWAFRSIVPQQKPAEPLDAGL